MTVVLFLRYKSYNHFMQVICIASTVKGECKICYHSAYMAPVSGLVLTVVWNPFLSYFMWCYAKTFSLLKKSYYTFV